MKTVIYSKPNCIFCEKAKELLDFQNIPYELKVLDVDFTREELLEMFPDAKTYPQIIFEGEHIGGFDNLAKKFG